MQIRNFSQGKGIVNQNEKTTNNLSKSLEKLSTGYRINRAADDASGLGISEKMKCSLMETGRVVNNVEEGISVTRVADGALQEVNDMIIRAQELTMQAANGTYTQDERDAIASEIRHLYAEMDRIFDSTTWNTINIFKLESYEYLTFDEEVEWNYDDYVYDESVQELGDVGLLPNSEIDWIEGKDFDDPEEGDRATASMQLDSYFFDNPDEMVGKTFKAGSVTYTVSQADVDAGYSGGEVDMEAILKATINRTIGSSTSTATTTYLDPDHVTVSEDGVVELGFQLNTYKQNVVIDGENTPYDTTNEEGDQQVSGLNANGTTVSSQNYYDFESEDLFKTGALQFETEATTEKNITILASKSASATLTTEEYNNLIRNTLYVGTSSLKMENILTSPTMTVAEIRQAVYDAIEGLGRYTVTGSPDSFQVTGSGLSSTSDGTSYSIYESAAPAVTGNLDTDGIPIQSVSVSEEVLVSPSGEGVAKNAYTIEFPSTEPYSIKIGGTEYTIIKESTKASDPEFVAANPGYTLASDNLSSNTTITISDNATEADILNAIAAKYSNSSTVSASVEGGQLILTARAANKEIGNEMGSGSNGTYTQTYKATNTEASKTVLGIGTTYLSRDMDLTFDFSSVLTNGELDVDKLSNLDNVAFKVGSYTYYLQGSSDEDYVPAIDTSANSTTTYRPIDVSGMTSLDDLANMIKTSMYSPKPTDVTINASGTFTLNYTNVRTGTGTTVSDSISPNLGLFTGYDDETGEANFGSGDPAIEGDLGSNQSSTADGGTLIGNPLTELDFGNYNASNISDLLGKGFTINCASCDHEKNTFIFLNSADDLGDLPQGSYTANDGTQYDINTYALELSKLDLSSAENFVASIAAEYNDILSVHTLEFVVDPENPTVLTIQDKRVGMVTGRLPTIETGVYGDYIYDVDKAPVDGSLNDPFYGLGWEKPLDYEEYWYGGLKIFVDSDMRGEDQYVTIRLPYLDALTLDIEPPKPILDAVSDAMEENAKLKAMGIKISEYRGNIGADYNRLQYAYGAFTTSEVYETDSMSTIRDADIALEMLKYTKENILLQSQQSMLSHSMESKNGLLQLLE